MPTLKFRDSFSVLQHPILTYEVCSFSLSILQLSAQPPIWSTNLGRVPVILMGNGSIVHRFPYLGILPTASYTIIRDRGFCPERCAACRRSALPTINLPTMPLLRFQESTTDLSCLLLLRCWVTKTFHHSIKRGRNPVRHAKHAPEDHHYPAPMTSDKKCKCISLGCQLHAGLMMATCAVMPHHSYFAS